MSRSTLRPAWAAAAARGDDRAEDEVFNERWIAGGRTPRFELARLRAGEGSAACLDAAGLVVFCKGLLRSPEGLGDVWDMWLELSVTANE